MDDSDFVKLKKEKHKRRGAGESHERAIFIRCDRRMN